MRKRAQHDTVASRKHAVAADEYWEYRPGDRVIADSLPGVVVAVQDGPFAGSESYTVELDNGAGGGEYTATQLAREGSVTASLLDTVALAEQLEQVEGSSQLTAATWYPELGDILTERLPLEQVTALRKAASERTAISRDFWAFKPGDRVLADGMPGWVIALVNPAPNQPVGGAQQYQVGLANGLGGGVFTQAQLQHTATLDDGMTGQLTDEPQQPPTTLDAWTQGIDDAQANQHTAATEPLGDSSVAGQEQGLPDVCSYCGNPGPWVDAQNTGRGARVRCATCGATMRLNDGGIQWAPEFPNSPQNHPSRQGDPRASIEHFVRVERLHEPGHNASQAQYSWELGHSHGYRWAPGQDRATSEEALERARAHEQQNPGYGRDYLDGFHEGVGEWNALNGDQSLVLAALNPAASAEAGYTIFHLPGYARALDEHVLRTAASLRGVADEDFAFQLTASWADVRQKAKRIRADGGVRILAAAHAQLVGEVTGDNAIYETSLQYIPGSRAVAFWTCGCKWAAWANTERFGRFKRFQNRPCSHNLALQYEANARGMFGREITLDTERPYYQRTPVQEQYQRPTSRAPERELTRRSVPPGNMRRQWDENSRVRVKGSLDAMSGEQEYAYDELEIPPSYQLGRTMLALGEPPSDVLRKLQALGVPHAAARQAIDWATKSDVSNQVFVDGIVRHAVAIDADRVTLDDGRTVTAMLHQAGPLIPGHGGGWYDDEERSKTPEEREADRERGRQLGEHLWNRMNEIFDPGGTDESRASQRRMEGMNHLLNLGYQPHEIHHSDEDEPYATVHHPSGWYLRDHGGPNVEIYHRATGDEAHEMLDVGDWASEGHRREVGAGPTEMAAHLHHWVDGDPEETGGAREYLEEHHPRIRRWKQQHLGAKAKDDAEDAEQQGEATAYPGGGSAEPGTDIPGIGDRDQTEKKQTDKRHLLHHTNDAREHAPEFGYGLPWGGTYMWCDQCNGSGCGHCGGTGQVAVGQGLPSDTSDLSSTEDPVPDQSVDAGSMIGADDSGMNATGSMRSATWIGDHPEEPTLYWRGRGPDRDGVHHEIHILNYTPSRELRENYGAKPHQYVEYRQYDVTNPNARPVKLGLGEDGELARIDQFGNWHAKPPTYIQQHLRHAADEVAHNAELHAELYGRAAEQRDIAEDLARVPRDMEQERRGHEMFRNLLRSAEERDDNPHTGARGHADERAVDAFDFGHDSGYQDAADGVKPRPQQFASGWYDRAYRPAVVEGYEHGHATWHNEQEAGLPHRGGSVHTADYSSNDFGVGLLGEDEPRTPTTFSQNPGSTGFATSADPHGWENPVVGDTWRRWGKKQQMESPTVAGVALKAADSGRILMIQRSNNDEKDPARGTWEIPGGHLEDGDQTSLHGAVREWEEEVGQPFPEGGHLTHVWRSGPYVGHVVVVPDESCVNFGDGRSTTNPDDPDGDDHEQSAWWDPDHARKNPALREECKAMPWTEITKAAGFRGQPPTRTYESPGRTTAGLGTLHDAPEPALPSTDGSVDDEAQDAAVPDSGLDADDTVIDDDTVVPGLGVQRDVPWGYPNSAADHPDPQVAHPDPIAELDLQGDDEGSAILGHTVSRLSPELATAAAANPTLAQFVQTPGFAALSAHPARSVPGAEGGYSAAQIADAAASFVKQSMKSFSYAEQQELIDEGRGKRVKARNFGDLRIEGTHYAQLGDDDGETDEFYLF